jgi:hypothetical protein
MNWRFATHCVVPLLVVSLLVLTFPDAAAGQMLGTNPHAFLQVGFNLAGTTTVRGHREMEGASRPGLHGGAGLHLQKGNTTSFLILLSYDQRRIRYHEHGDWYDPAVGHPATGEWDHDVSITYVSAALHVQCFPLRTLPVFVGGGPEVGLPGSGTDKLTWRSMEVVRNFDSDIAADVGSPDFALVAEAGVRLAVGPLFCTPTVSYTIGLTEVGGDDGRSGGLETGLGSAKYRMLGLSLGIRGR